MGLEPLNSRHPFLSARFEKVGKRFVEIDLKCDKEFLEIQDALVSAKEVQRLVEDVEAAENDLKEELGLFFPVFVNWSVIPGECTVLWCNDRLLNRNWRIVHHLISLLKIDASTPPARLDQVVSVLVSGQLGTLRRTPEVKNQRATSWVDKTEKALDTLAISCARFEMVSKSLGEVDQEFVEMQDAVERAKEAQRSAVIAATASS